MLKRVIKLLLKLFLFSFILQGCFLLPKEEKLLAPPLMETPEISYKTTPVKRGTLEKSIRVAGYFVYGKQVSVSFKSMSGRIASIAARYGDVVAKGDVLAAMETDNLENLIQKLEIQKKIAQLTYERKKILGSGRIELEIAELNIQLLQLSLDEQLANRERSLLRSPIAGEVIYTTDIYEGDLIPGYKTLFQVADISKLYLSYQGSSLSEFRLGMDVIVIFNNTDYNGKVIMTPAEFPYDAPDSQKRQIIFEVEDLPSGEAEKGDYAGVYLILEQSKYTLIIPGNQVQRYMGRKFVYVLEEGLRVERNIQTGIENSTETEILLGLEEGELIVLR